MNYFSDTFGLVTKSDPTTENSGLFYAYYLMLKQMNNISFTTEDNRIFISKMEQAKTAYGLFKRTAHHTKRTVSHDEITGMLATSHVLWMNYHHEIMTYLIANKGNYPATGENKRYLPANYFAWNLLCGIRPNWFIYSWYKLSMIISINKAPKETSSKLIYLLELWITKDFDDKAEHLWNIYKKQMTKQYGENWVGALFKRYFHQEENDFPLLELSRGLKL